MSPKGTTSVAGDTVARTESRREHVGIHLGRIGDGPRSSVPASTTALPGHRPIQPLIMSAGRTFDLATATQTSVAASFQPILGNGRKKAGNPNAAPSTSTPLDLDVLPSGCSVIAQAGARPVGNTILGGTIVGGTIAGAKISGAEISGVKISGGEIPGGGELLFTSCAISTGSATAPQVTPSIVQVSTTAAASSGLSDASEAGTTAVTSSTLSGVNGASTNTRGQTGTSTITVAVGTVGSVMFIVILALAVVVWFSRRKLKHIESALSTSKAAQLDPEDGAGAEYPGRWYRRSDESHNAAGMDDDMDASGVSEKESTQAPDRMSLMERATIASNDATVGGPHLPTFPSPSLPSPRSPSSPLSAIATPSSPSPHPSPDALPPSTPKHRQDEGGRPHFRCDRTATSDAQNDDAMSSMTMSNASTLPPPYET